MKLSHRSLIIISGLVWFAIGVYLLQLGVNLLLIGTNQAVTASTNYLPLLNWLRHSVGNIQNAALLLIVIALFIGYLKGRYVLGKSAQKGVTRIRAFPNPTSIARIYNSRYYILIGAMMGLGISIKYLGLSNDVRGFIDAIIGSALINGAMIYFKLAQDLKVESE